MDRIVLGQHANTKIGAGLYVSIPGANVMHPEHAQAANLLFDSNELHSTLNIIQTGTFKITCSRKAISGRGETIGNRLNDTQELLDNGDAHTFAHDTGRPSNLTTLANWDVAKTVGYQDKSFGKKVKGKQSNYLDTGSQTITIASPLSNGEVPEVALRFAVGNSSGHFHPWYANVTTSGSHGNWDEWTYNDSTQIVHMDSNWMRLKWGGLGAEEYRGIQNEYTYSSLLSFFGGDAQKIVDKFGFSNATDAQNKLKNSKLLSLAINNSQGVVGLIPYVDATSFTVDAYMSPTHAGLRQPVDRTFEKNKGRQKGVGFNAIDDYAHINFPMETHPHTNTFTDTQISEDLNARKFKHLPGIPLPGDIYRDDGGDFDREDHGKRDMYGWGGHPTEFFVNPFSNANLTFYTHMQPPYVTNKGTKVLSGNTYTGHYLPIGYEGEPSGTTHPFHGGSFVVNQVWGPDSVPSPDAVTAGLRPSEFELSQSGSGSQSISATPIGGLHSYEDTFTRGSSSDIYMQSFPNFGYMRIDDEIIYYASTTRNIIAGNKVTYKMFYEDVPIPFPLRPPGGRGALRTNITAHAAGAAVFDWNPTVPINRTNNENQWHKGTAGTPSRSVFSGAGVKWPPGDPHADYLDHRDWTGSMGLAGAGSKEAMAVDDVWDTFYCSYTVYSTGSSPPRIDAQVPKTVTINATSTSKGGNMWKDAKYRNDRGPNGTGAGTAIAKRYFNLVFPDDFVEEIGVSGKDPFWEHRDPATKKIYGNVNVLFKIPNLNAGVAGDYVRIGSEDFVYDDLITYYGDVYPNGASTGRPAPAITFDFSDSKFLYENNNGVTLTIENTGYVLGGGGSGGAGTKALNIGNIFDANPVSTSAKFSGGGGGAGRGSGYIGTSKNTLLGAAPGTGMGGAGWGRGKFFNHEGAYNTLAATKYGTDGSSLGLVSSVGGEYSTVGMAGGVGSSEENNVMQILLQFAPGAGGNGGNAFEMVYSSVLPSVEIINKSSTSAGPARRTYIAAGGGGGGGGHGYIGSDSSSTAAADGGRVGQNANDPLGNPGSSSILPPANPSNPNIHAGGRAGYIIGGYLGGRYPGEVTIRNETEKTQSVVGRSPSGDSSGPYNIDVSVGSGTTIKYK